MTIEGEVVEFDYRAPHAWLHVNAPDAQGRSALHGGMGQPAAPDARRRHRDTVRPATRSHHRQPRPHRNEYKMHLKGIQRRKDGWSWRQRPRSGR